MIKEIINKVELQIYLHESDICTDPTGMQSITVFQDDVFAYIATSAYFFPESICYSIYDLTYLEEGRIKHVDTQFYYFSDFNKNTSIAVPKFTFNIRDFVFFNIAPIYNQRNGVNDLKHFLVATWYNNGLMFF